MTYALLPADRVHRACRSTGEKLAAERRDLQRRYEEIHRTLTLETHGSLQAVEIQAKTVGERMLRVDVLGELAWAVREGTIALSLEDFSLIRQAYQAGPETG